jgi:hypothetical protein
MLSFVALSYNIALTAILLRKVNHVTTLFGESILTLPDPQSLEIFTS